MSLHSKLSRAIAGYLVSAGVGSVDNIFPYYSVKQRDFPNITVVPTHAVPDAPLSGNYRFTLNVVIQGSAVNAGDEPNPESKRVDFDALAESVSQALMISDDDETLRATYRLINTAAAALAVAVDPGDPAAVLFAANNADMVNFTIMQWIDRGFANAEALDEGCSWSLALTFECLCCASQVAGYT